MQPLQKIDFAELKKINCIQVALAFHFTPDTAGKIHCPFHTGDSGASLQLYVDHWHCYGCGAHGDALDFTKRMLHVNDQTAAQWLTERFNGPLLRVQPKPMKGAIKDLPNRARDRPGQLEREHIYPNGTKKLIYRNPDGTKYAVWLHREKENWAKGRGDAPHTLYRAGDVSSVVYAVEGEKDAETLAALGCYAVSGENGAGTGKWLSEYTAELSGTEYINVIGDNDEPGRIYAEETAVALLSVTKHVKLLDLKVIWPDMPEKADVSDMIQHFGPEKACELLYHLESDTAEYVPFATVATVTQNPGAEEWPDPDWFENFTVPDFPINCLPSVVAEFVAALSESTQTPKNMSAVLSLGVLATLFQRRFSVRVTPDWSEPLCLWPVAVAEPGERKSAVFSALLNPLFEYERERQKAEQAEMVQIAAKRDVLEGMLKEAKKAKKGVTVDERMNTAIRIAAELSQLKEKHPFRLVMDDTTIEKLGQVMQEQEESITIASAEGGIFDTISGRYDKSGNLDIYLKGHAGDRYTVDRITRSRNTLEYPRLSLILTVQPLILRTLMQNQSMRGKGLCGRFLYALCETAVGHRRIDVQPIPDPIRERYHDFVKTALETTQGGFLTLSAEADKLRQVWQQEIETAMASGMKWADSRDWHGKLTGATVRIAALFHLTTRTNTSMEISATAMQNAIKVALVLAEHASIAYHIGLADPANETALKAWTVIQKHGPELSQRQLSRLSHIPAVDIENAIRVLAERGYVRTEIISRKSGRPTTNIIANPKAIEGKKGTSLWNL